MLKQVLAALLLGLVTGVGAGPKESAPKRPWVLVQTPASSCYTLGEFRGGYLQGRWNDQPLLPDVSLGFNPASKRKWSVAGFRKMREEIKSYDLDAIGFFSEVRGAEYLPYSRDGVLPAVPIIIFSKIDERNRRGRLLNSFAELQKGNVSLKINGKQLVASYWTDRRFTPEELKNTLKKLRQTYGDCFAMTVDCSRLAYGTLHHYYSQGQPVPAEKLEPIKAQLRAFCRAADGLYFGETHVLHRLEDGMRVFDGKYYREVVIPLLKSILNEPEFKGKKILGLSALAGHENNYAVGYQCSHNNTRTLRESLEIALAAQPDYIQLPEWNEYNENTSLAPTMLNSFTHKRLLRYYLAKIKGEKLKPLPTDNVEIPNWVISYRSKLALGELLKIEVLNIPDGSLNRPVRGRLCLSSASGKVLKRFPEFQLDGRILQECTFSIPTETLASERVLRIKLELKRSKLWHRWDQGLPTIELLSSGNNNYRYAKQPLRDIMPKVATQLLLTPAKSGLIKAEISVNSQQPVAFAELLINGYPRAIFDRTGQLEVFRTTPERVCFEICSTSNQYSNRPAVCRLKGGATGRWFCAGDIIEGDKCTYPIDAQYRPNVYLALPMANLPGAVLEVTNPESGTISIDLEKLATSKIKSWSAANKFNLTVSRYCSQLWYPPFANQRQIKFTTWVELDLPSNVLQVQVRGMDGKLYRGQPQIWEDRQAAQCTMEVYSVAQKRPVQVKVPCGRVPLIQPDISGAWGGVLPCRLGRAFWGMAGGPVALACGLNRSDGTAGAVVSDDGRYVKLPGGTGVPQFKMVNGQPELHFDGLNDFILFPANFLPRTCSFRLEFEFKPQDLQRKQMVFGNGIAWSSKGTIWGLWLQEQMLKLHVVSLDLKDETLFFDLPVQVGKWQKVVLESRIDKMRLTVAGQSSPWLAVPFPGRYDVITGFGGAYGQFFRGAIRNIKISHCLDK